MQYFEFDTLDSTNDQAKRMIAAGEITRDAYIVAREQTAGRGTQSRAWVSPRDTGLYLSVILIDVGAISTTTQLITMICGVACAEVLHCRYGVDLRLKPVNDLILDGRKMGGILTEATIEVQKLKHLIVGVGLNLRHTELSLPADAMQPAFLESGVPNTCSIHAADLALPVAERIANTIRHLNPEAIQRARMAWDRLSIKPFAWPA